VQLQTAMLNNTMAIMLEKSSMGVRDLQLECCFQSTSRTAIMLEDFIGLC